MNPSTLAVILVVFAITALLYVGYSTVSKKLQTSKDNSRSFQIEPLDVEAFRNLVDPAEREYLRRRLPAPEFREVQRQRLRAMADYVHVAARNAAILVSIAQAALSSSDPRTVETARHLIDNAMLVRRNAFYALFRINVALAWPNSGLAAAPILHGYERLNGSAMLLGRLQNPAVPVRISAM
jgi:hypothetical protein